VRLAVSVCTAGCIGGKIPFVVTLGLGAGCIVVALRKVVD
jgi:hypothetical protein